MQKNLWLLFLLPCVLFGKPSIDFEQLSYDLELIYWIDHVLERNLPIHYNYIFSTGYFVTPSARMAEEGEIGFGYSHLHPYDHYNIRIQPFKRLELSINWRIFKGVDDIGLSPQGYGNFSDRGANCKFSLLTPEESGNILPGIAFGIEDFMGSQRFTNYFVVGTKVWQPLGLEFSLGWGHGRYHGGFTRGLFGAFSWHPFFFKNSPLLMGLAFSAEYDPINYICADKEPHGEARHSSFPINFGLQYNYRDLIHFSLSRWRGEVTALTASYTYNWGETLGLFPKINDPPLFTERFARQDEICEIFETQGFKLRSLYLQNELAIITLSNILWIRESDMRNRLAYLLSFFPYTDVKRFIVVIEAYQLRCQSYYFSREWLESYCGGGMGQFEFDLLTDRREPLFQIPQEACLLYACNQYIPKVRIQPRFETFLGSAKGKFKYDIGIVGQAEGYLPYHLYYEASCSVTAISTARDVSDFDFYNPSQLPNVATDYVNYRNQGGFSTEKLYVQSVYNYCGGFFSRISGGYYQVNYAGFAGEILWYPARSSLALGIEAALLKKRNYSGLGFQSTLRILEGTTATYQSYNFLEQYFFDIYLDIPACSLFTKVSIGSFLAKDKGARFSLTRYYQSGLRFTVWLSMTNAYDTMHSARYFDRGVAVEMPLELFFKKSCRRVFSYGLGAWLRDAGYRSQTGRALFDILNCERRF